MQCGSGPLKSTTELGYLEPNRICNKNPYSQVDSELLCCICQNVLWKPVACSTCENSFCAECMRTWTNKQNSFGQVTDSMFQPTLSFIQVTCPFNCAFRQKRAPPILNSFLSKLQIYCAYAPNGCEEVLSYDGLEKHEQECQYELTPCQICETPVSHRDQNNKHELRQCFKEMYDRNPDNVQAQFIKLLDVVEASQQRIQALEKLLRIEPQKYQ